LQEQERLVGIRMRLVNEQHNASSRSSRQAVTPFDP
jgi:hypothetical protein